MAIITILFVWKATNFYLMKLDVIIAKPHPILYSPKPYMVIIIKSFISKRDRLIENSCQNTKDDAYPWKKYNVLFK